MAEKRRKGDLARRKRRESKALDGENQKYNVKCPYCEEIHKVKMRKEPIIMLRIAHEHCKAKQAKMEEVGR